MARSVLVMLAVAFVAFALGYRSAPLRDGGEAPGESSGFDDPFFLQYLRFLGKALQGDLGDSSLSEKPALEVIASQALPTLELVLVGGILVVSVSVPVGARCASNPRGTFSRIAAWGSMAGECVPVFLTAIVLVYVFSVKLQWLPPSERGEAMDLWGWKVGVPTLDGWRHLALPALALSSAGLPFFVALVRRETMKIQEREHVRFARARGLPVRYIRRIHVFRSALPAILSAGGAYWGFFLACAMVVETVFRRQGLGLVLLEAARHSDVSLFAACLVVVGFLLALASLVTDLARGLMDPPVRMAGRK